MTGPVPGVERTTPSLLHTRTGPRLGSCRQLAARREPIVGVTGPRMEGTMTVVALVVVPEQTQVPSCFRRTPDTSGDGLGGTETGPTPIGTHGPGPVCSSRPTGLSGYGFTRGPFWVPPVQTVYIGWVGSSRRPVFSAKLVSLPVAGLVTGVRSGSRSRSTARGGPVGTSRRQCTRRSTVLRCVSPPRLPSPVSSVTLV